MAVAAPSVASVLGSLPDVAKSFLEWANAHNRQLHSYQRFFEMLARVVRKQAPEFLPALSVLSKPFNAALRYERVLVAAERRLAEDLRDLVARYEVLIRLRNEHQTIMKQISDSRSRIEKLRVELDEDRRRGCVKQAKLTIDLALARDRRRKAVDEGRSKLQEIIAERQKYSAFYVRRLRHGYSYLGDILTEASRRIALACEVFRDLVGDIRANLDAVFEGTYDFDAEPETVCEEEDEEEEHVSEGEADKPPE